MPEVLADNPATQGNHAEYDHDPRIGRPARVDCMAHLRQIIVRFHTEGLGLVVAVMEGSVTGTDLGRA